MLTPWKESCDQLRQHIKKERHYFANKSLHSQSYGFSSNHVWMWELDYKESWELKNWCFWIVVLEEIPESPVDCKEIQTVHPKGNQSWMFIGRIDAKAETPIRWPTDEKNWLIWNDPDTEKYWIWEERWTTEDGMVVSSPTRWTWVWVNSWNWWWTGEPDLRRVRHDWVTELNWNESLEKEAGHCFIAEQFFLVHSSFVSAFSSLISNCLSLLFETQGRSRRVKPFSFKQETGNTENICTQESLAVSFSVSAAVLSKSTWATVAPVAL